MATDPAQSRIFLSTLTADAGERRRALTSAIVFLVLFLVSVPFARVPLPQVWGFIPSYQSALVTCDLITVVLLLAQFVILRARSLLPLALGYLFCALIAIAHVLTFPDLFSPEGLLGAQPQTTALALYGLARWVSRCSHCVCPARQITKCGPSGR